MSVNIPIWRPTQYPITFYFPITRETIYYIQKYRDANLSGSLRLTLQVAHYPDPPKTEPNNPTSLPSIYLISTTSGHRDFVIEQSRWVNNVLPGLGYDAPTLIELPNISAALPVEYANALTELSEARRYFAAGDYHKTVVHCRIALDRIHDQFPREKDKLPKDGRFQWLQANMKANYSFAETIIDANYSMSNKAHHASGVKFERVDAETILLMTTVILAYIGKILPTEIPPIF